jgi:hypothetical protein
VLLSGVKLVQWLEYGVAICTETGYGLNEQGAGV